MLIPLGWQRSSDLAAAFETGPGGYNFGYTVVRGSAAAQRYDTPFEITGMEMSPDGSHVLGTWIFEDAVKVWPTDDFDSKTTLASPPNKIATAHWWPRSSEIVYMIGAVNGQWVFSQLGIPVHSRIAFLAMATLGAVILIGAAHVLRGGSASHT